MNRPLRSPLKVSLMAFGLTIAIGAIVGVILISVLRSGDAPYARGQKFGQGLAQLSVFVGVIAYIVQWRRTNKRS